MRNPVRRAARKIRPGRETPAERLIRALAACCSAAEMTELYYWSREPGLREVVRGIAAMPEETRAALEAFVTLARDTRAVSAELDRRGVLTLVSAQAARTAALALHAAEEDADDLPRMLN
jgi:hypothetical protein